MRCCSCLFFAVILERSEGPPHCPYFYPYTTKEILCLINSLDQILYKFAAKIRIDFRDFIEK